jgi:hypothetical protein
MSNSYQAHAPEKDDEALLKSSQIFVYRRTGSRGDALGCFAVRSSSRSSGYERPRQLSKVDHGVAYQLAGAMVGCLPPAIRTKELDTLKPELLFTDQQVRGIRNGAEGHRRRMLQQEKSCSFFRTEDPVAVLLLDLPGGRILHDSQMANFEGGLHRMIPHFMGSGLTKVGQ